MPPEQQPIRHLGERLFLNSLSGGARFVVTSVVLVVLYPFMFERLGANRFGLWVMLGMTGQYAALGDFGVLNALVKLAAEKSPGRTRLRALAGAAIVPILCLASVFLVVICAGYRPILIWLRIAPEFMPEARILLLVTPGLICLQLMGMIYTSVLSSLQRMDLANVILTTSFVANGAGIFVALKLGGGLIELMLVSALVAFGTWISAVLIVIRITGERWSVLPTLVPSAVRELLGFGSPLYIAALAGLLLEPSIKVLLSRYSGLATVSSFELASRVATQCRSLFHQLLLPMLPASSLLAGDSDRLGKMYSRSIRMLQVTAVPGFLILAGFAPAIVHLWLGVELTVVHNGMTLLLIGWLFNLLTVPAYLLLQGMGYPRAAMNCSLLQGTIAIAGGFLLISRVGFYGAIGSLVVALAVAAAYVQRQFLRFCPEVSEPRTTAQPLRKLAAPLVLIVFLALVRFWKFSDSILLVLVLGVTGMGIYLALLLWAEAPGTSPRAFVQGFFPQTIIEKVLVRDRR